MASDRRIITKKEQYCIADAETAYLESVRTFPKQDKARWMASLIDPKFEYNVEKARSIKGYLMACKEWDIWYGAGDAIPYLDIIMDYHDKKLYYRYTGKSAN